MSSAIVSWVRGKIFIGTDSTNHSVVISTPDEGVGMKPSDLLLVALASCTAVDVVEILAKKRLSLDNLMISTSAEQDPEPPWAFRKVHIKYSLRGKNLTEKDVAKAIELSETKYCSVAASIRGTTQITTEFEIFSGMDDA
jgi:putative redox protein